MTLKALDPSHQIDILTAIVYKVKPSNNVNYGLLAKVSNEARLANMHYTWKASKRTPRSELRECLTTKSHHQSKTRSEEIVGQSRNMDKDLCRLKIRRGMIMTMIMNSNWLIYPRHNLMINY